MTSPRKTFVGLWKTSRCPDLRGSTLYRLSRACHSSIHCVLHPSTPLSDSFGDLESGTTLNWFAFARTAGDGDMAAYNFAAEKLRQWPTQDLAPELLVSGDDLIAMGLAPGPLFKEILTKVEDEQLEGRLTTREQALDFIKERYPAK